MADLILRIKADDQASAALKGISGELNTIGKTAGTGMSGIGAAASKAVGPLQNMAQIAGGFVIGQAITSLPGMLTGTFDAAADAERSVVKLNTALQNAGQSGAAQAMEATAAAALKLGISDEDARDSLAMLVAQTGSAAEAQKRFQLAMDLSRGTGMDLATASKLLGKATDENANVLSRYGITMRKGATDTELMAAVQAKFGGQAQAFAQTAAGSWQQFQQQIGETQESIGAALLPAMTQLGQALVPVITAFAGLIAQNPQAVLITLGVAAAALVIGFTAWAASAVAAGIATMVALAPILVPIALITAAVALLAVAWTQNWGDIQGKTAAVVAFITGAFEGLVGFFTGLPAAIGAAFSQFGTNIQTAVQAVIAWLQANWPLIIAILTGPLGLAVLAIVTHWQEIQTAFATAVTAVLGVLQGLAGVPGMIGGFLAQAVAKVGEFAGNLMAALGTVVQQALTTAQAIGQAILDGIWNIIQTIGTSIANFDGLLTGALNTVIGTAGQIASTIGWAIINGVTGAINAGWQGLKDLVGNLASSLLDAAKKALGIGSPSQEFYKIGESIVDGMSGGLESGYGKLKTVVVGMARALKAGGAAAAGAGGVFDWNAARNMSQLAEGYAKESRVTWGEVEKGRAAGYVTDTGYVNMTAYYSAMAGRQFGGNVRRGLSYIVGERGAELFTPSTSGRITPRGEIGGVTVHVHVAGSVLAQDDLAQTIRQTLVKIGRNTTGLGLA